jgi:hypothetical protein
VAAVASPDDRRLLVHRVIRCQAGRIQTRGDGNLQPDGWSQADQILGVVVKVERDGQPARFGLGPERWVIALLTRIGFWPRLQAVRRRVMPQSR